MNNQQIIRCLQECATKLDISLNISKLERVDIISRFYEDTELSEFQRDLIEAGNESGIVLLEKHMEHDVLMKFISDSSSPTIVFLEQDGFLPAFISKKKKEIVLEFITQTGQLREVRTPDFNKLKFSTNAEGEVFTLTSFAYQSFNADGDSSLMTPVKRLFNLLSADKKDIFYVYVYAALIGLVSLTLPLGIQAAVELISGGVVFSSVYLLITLIILGVLGTGVLQVLQITIVEYLQRRVFTKAAFEFAFRVPRIKMESVLNMHMPELMNRFFDVLTLQKGLPKLLIDLSTGLIQILFGLLLLSFYHPFFIIFGLGLIGLLFLIFYLTGPKGLKSSIQESKYKYKVVYWLEEMARTLYSFKLAGNTILPLKKTDYFVNNYLKHRSAHFKVLISQYSFILLFKAIVTGGLLILGTILVVQREITLGQFVASEVIIILVLNSVEKIIMYMDIVYDMLTAVDKISHVTDLPLEESGGIDIPHSQMAEGLDVKLENVSYTYPGSKRPSLSHLNIEIPKGGTLCISGGSGAGKTTLTNIIAGIHQNYEGILTYNDLSLRDLDSTYIRDRIGKNVSQEDIFEGSVLENILVGKPTSDIDHAIAAIKEVGLSREINALENGLNTQILSAGKGFSSSFVNKLVLARCLAKRPAMLILNDFFNNFTKAERLKLIEMLTRVDKKWTLIVVSNDPLVMAACDRVLYLENGEAKALEPFDELIKRDEIIKEIY
ncbi:ABC-type bacteriocin/lantibiotic exporter, contains an N-terminal double-glycine peptidase domain [Ekhidna lutea]|uniref:ABC-type bacteriocin/lantibiotic exporter, contains an N-terminal double-glycine peptidase domain n=1 Tax=Ekhidna lutea TaxID=447679 RepID=A0A239J959_EKHLU|nr:ABC transporter ATP-binding protein [Ekhidna lutea]SNT02370.1 ABC-type bacteriocin/lantibiotic exporter, contains an N-terminal double-glycine peptidase domain [Ekhidna lutea]